MSKIIELSRIQLNEMRKPSKKRNKPIASLEDAEETLRKIWYIHKQKEQKINELLSYVNGAIASGLSSKDKAVAYYLRGILYYWQQRYADAEADLRKALNIDERLGDPTRCANAHVLLADICDLRQNIGEAIKLCQNGIVQLNTFSDVKSKQYAAEIFCYLADLYIRLTPSDIDYALLCLFYALDIDSPPPEAFYFLGIVCEKMGDLEHAIELYEYCLQLLSNKALYASLCYYYKDIKRLAQDRLKILKAKAPS